MSGFFAWLGQAAVIAVGWFVVHKLTAQRDKEKTRREVLVKITDALSKNVDDIFADARAYHLEPRQFSSELKLKMALQDLGIRVAGLSDIYNEQSLLGSARSGVAAFRRAITGTHFEDEHAGPLHENAPQHMLIAEAALELKRVLLKIMNRQIGPS